MKYKIATLIIILTVSLLTGCIASPTHTDPYVEPVAPVSTDIPISPDIPKIRLSQGIIDQAVTECETQSSWGINLAKVNINYVAGANVEAAIVVHNGDDVERLVTISYRPIYETTINSEEINAFLGSQGMSGAEISNMPREAKILIAKDAGLSYEPAPIQASGWVTIDIDKIRMQTMETQVIPIRLLVPENTSGLPDRWEFNVKASGTGIFQYQYTILVTTVENDTVLELSLPYPLLDNSLESIKDIISTESEIPYATNYDIGSNILTIEGLNENLEREITIIYEYGEPIIIDYHQRWLINMIG